MSIIVVAALISGLAVLAAWPPTDSRLNNRPGRVGSDTPLQRSAMVILSGVAGALATVSLGWWSLGIGGAAAAASAIALHSIRTESIARRQRSLAAALPQTCDLLAVSLEAGLPVRRGAAVVAEVLPAPMSELLAEAVAKTELGIDEHRVWQELSAEPALAGLGRELGRGAATGISLTARLRVLAADARKRQAAVAQARAKRVGVRSVLPLMMCFLPAFVLLGLVPILGGMLGVLFR